MTVLPILFAAVLTTAVRAPRAEVSGVRFPVPGLQVIKARSGSSHFIRGPVRVDMSFRQARVNKPILKIACLCDVDGRLTCFMGLWGGLRTNTRLSDSEISEAFRQAGFEPASDGREAACADPRLVSEKTCNQVAKEKYAGASYGSTAANAGFFRIGDCAATPKLLVHRLELWQNGVQVGAYESSHTGLGQYDLPADWHAWRKYPQRFRYVDK